MAHEHSKSDLVTENILSFLVFRRQRAEWLARRTRNPAVKDLSQVLRFLQTTSWICYSAGLEFKFSATLVNSQII